MAGEAEAAAEAAAGATEADVAVRLELINTQAKQMQQSAKQMAATACSGFHIEPEAAATLIKACLDSIHELNKLDAAMFDVSQAPKLGDTPGAKVVAPFTQQVATDGQGIAPAIVSLKQTLNDMMAAYQKASTNYAETQSMIQELMRKQQAGLK